MCMVLGASEAWWFFFLFFHAFSQPLPLASPSCPSPPTPLPYWEVFHEQLGPGRGEVSERGALCIIQWLSGVCVCACVSVRVCVALPLLLAGVRWQAGHVSACQLAFYWSSHTVHNITISWWGRLRLVLTRALWSEARMSHGTLRLCQRQSTYISTHIFSFTLSWASTRN